MHKLLKLVQLPVILFFTLFITARPSFAHFVPRQSPTAPSTSIHAIDILFILLAFVFVSVIFKMVRNPRRFNKALAYSLIGVYVITFLGLCTYVHLFEKDLSSHSIHAKNCFKPKVEKGLEIVQLPAIVTSYEPIELFTPEIVITPSLITKDIRSPPSTS